MAKLSPMEHSHTQPTPWVILYDGVCGWCTGWVRFLLKRDSTTPFKFSSLQSSLGRQVLEHLHLSSRNFTTFVVLTPEGPFTKSTAVIQICRQLKGFKWFGKILSWVPLTIRDTAYNLIARNRYHLRGKLPSCYLPPQEFVDRFIQDGQWVEGVYPSNWRFAPPDDSSHV